MKRYDSLLLGIGNIGRQDDGLGWMFVDAVESQFHDRFEYIRRYQLNIEDADLFSARQHILVIDATKDATVDAFRLSRVEPSNTTAFSSHVMAVGSVLALCQQLYGKQPNVELLEIKGEEWELQEGLTATAQSNLDKALEEMFRQRHL